MFKAHISRCRPTSFSSLQKMEEFEARDTEDWGPFPVLQDAFAGQNPWLYVRIKHLRIF